MSSDTTERQGDSSLLVLLGLTMLVVGSFMAFYASRYHAYVDVLERWAGWLFVAGIAVAVISLPMP